MLGKNHDENESFITEPLKCSCTEALFTDSCKPWFDAHVSLCSCLVLPAWASVRRLERINIILIGEQIQGAHHSLHGEGKGHFHIRTSTRLGKHFSACVVNYCGSFLSNETFPNMFYSKFLFPVLLFSPLISEFRSSQACLFFLHGPAVSD